MEDNSKTLELIEKIKSNNDSAALVELISLYEKICYKVASNLVLPEFFSTDKDVIIFEAAKEFDPNKSKFTTFLTLKTRFFLYKKINSHKREIKYINSDFDLDALPEPLVETYDYCKVDLLPTIINSISNFGEREKKIFELRFFSGEKTMSWKNIGQKIGVSGQCVINTFQKCLKKIRKDIPEEIYK